MYLYPATSPILITESIPRSLSNIWRTAELEWHAANQPVASMYRTNPVNISPTTFGVPVAVEIFVTAIASSLICKTRPPNS